MSLLPRGIDQGELALLRREFGELPPELKRKLRPRLRSAGRVVVREAQRKASWSTRIPAAIRLVTRLGSRNAGLFIQVAARNAPHARPYENLGRQGTFRHPVFWPDAIGTAPPSRIVSQRARPFLFPAVDRHHTTARVAASNAVADAARAHEWK